MPKCIWVWTNRSESILYTIQICQYTGLKNINHTTSVHNDVFYSHGNKDMQVFLSFNAQRCKMEIKRQLYLILTPLKTPVITNMAKFVWTEKIYKYSFANRGVGLKKKCSKFQVWIQKCNQILLDWALKFRAHSNPSSSHGHSDIYWITFWHNCILWASEEDPLKWHFGKRLEHQNVDESKKSTVGSKA